MHRFVASGFGSGLILPRLRSGDASGSGTVGAAVGLAIAWLLAPYGWVVQLLAAVVAIALSVWSARPFSKANEDPGWIVMDEVAGMLVAAIGIAGWGLVVSFVVFRIADISKRFPGVAAAERLGGPVGITADDVVAGLWGLAAAWAWILLT